MTTKTKRKTFTKKKNNNKTLPREDAIDFRYIQWLETAYTSKKRITIDARCIGNSPKGFYYFTKNNGLNAVWGQHKVFLQLPMTGSKEIRAWLMKAYSEAQRDGCEVWVFCPRVVTSNSWFTDYATKAKKIIFLQGRVVLEGQKERIPHSSCFMLFDGKVLGGPIITSAPIKEILGDSDPLTKEREEFEIKKKVVSEDEILYYPKVKPTEIQVDPVKHNDTIYTKGLGKMKGVEYV